MSTRAADRLRPPTTARWSGQLLAALLALVATLAGACTGADDPAAAPSSTEAAAAEPADPAAVIDAYIDAYNADDMDAVLALFTDESTILRHPFGAEVNGLDGIAILQRSDRNAAAADAPYTVTAVDVDGTTVTWDHRWTNVEGDTWCGEGNRAEVADGAIVEWEFAPNPRPCP